MKRLFLILSILIFTMSCSQKSSQTENSAEHQHEEAPSDLIELTEDQQRIGNIVLGKVENRNMGQLLQVNGRLAVPPQSQLTITALQGGFVRTLPLLPGQPVQKGQVLARIENPDLITIQQEYAENLSRLPYLEAEYTRHKSLSEQNVASLKSFQQTAAERDQLRARQKGLAQRMQLVGISPQTVADGKFTTSYLVRAPESGVVTDVVTTIGQYVQPADVIARITSTKGLYAELTVFEKDLPQIREGQRISVILNNEAGRERTGRITFINRAIDEDRSVRVVAKLDQADSRLTPNTFLKASLNLGDSRVTALPEEAIVSTEGKDFIFIVTNEAAPEHHHDEEEGHKHEEEEDSEDEHEHGTVFKQIQVRRGITENGYSQVILPDTFNLEKNQVVIKGAYAILSQLKAASGEEEGHAH